MEKLKHFVNARYVSDSSDPRVALARDMVATGGAFGADINQFDQQNAILEALVAQKRRALTRMANVLKDAEIRHRAVRRQSCCDVYTLEL